MVYDIPEIKKNLTVPCTLNLAEPAGSPIDNIHIFKKPKKIDIFLGIMGVWVLGLWVKGVGGNVVTVSY